MSIKNIRIQLSSSGTSEGAVLSGVRKDHPDRLFLFSGDEVKSHAITIEQQISEMYKIYVKTVIVDEFDVMDCLTKVVRIAKKEKRKADENNYQIEFSINITGGTKILSAAMLMAANILSSDVFYIKSPRALDNSLPVELDEKINIPIPKPFFEQLSKVRQKILLLINEIDNATIVKIGKRLKISKQAISNYVKDLYELDLINKINIGREKILIPTASGLLYLSVLNL